MNCPADLDVANDLGQCGKTNPYLGTTLSVDNCSITTISNNSPGTFPVGTTAVTWTVGDAAGNQQTCIQTVTIRDEEWPSISCPPVVNAISDPDLCSAIVDFAVEASDNCPGWYLDYSEQPSSSFNLGYTEVTATVTDAEGHWANCLFLVHVDARKEVCNGIDDDCDGLVDEAEDWTRVLKHLTADGGSGDQYGYSFDVHGVWAIAGAPNKSAGGQKVGAAYILYREPTGWAMVKKLEAPAGAEDDQFGHAVAIDAAGVVAIGAPGDDEAASNGGAVFVFGLTDPDYTDSWSLVKKLTASDASANDRFGSSVALSGPGLLVGKPNDDADGPDAGAAYVYNQNMGGSGNWGEVGKLVANDGAAGNNFGASVAIDGQLAVVGAPNEDTKGINAGAIYIFDGASNWAQFAKRVAKTRASR
ncbi:MAG: HYR domain-containing protein [Lewinellaceae bacterium]|nr:HYR domain-containing protein [Lewinellaceae bacterium]